MWIVKIGGSWITNPKLTSLISINSLNFITLYNLISTWIIGCLVLFTSILNGDIRWISNLNANKQNHYKELLEARENVKNQRHIIARLSQQISELSLCLASQVKQPPTESVDLISFD